MEVCTPIVSGGHTCNSATGVIGFATGAGSLVTQTTDRATGVTIDAPTGKITTDTTSLGAEVSAEFTVTNSLCALNDIPVVAIRSGANGGNTAVAVSTVANGSFKIRVSNNNAAGGTAETGAIVINFAIFKGAST